MEKLHRFNSSFYFPRVNILKLEINFYYTRRCFFPSHICSQITIGKLICKLNGTSSYTLQERNTAVQK